MGRRCTYTPASVRDALMEPRVTSRFRVTARGRLDPGLSAPSARQPGKGPSDAPRLQEKDKAGLQRG